MEAPLSINNKTGIVWYKSGKGIGDFILRLCFVCVLMYFVLIGAAFILIYSGFLQDIALSVSNGAYYNQILLSYYIIIALVTATPLAGLNSKQVQQGKRSYFWCTLLCELIFAAVLLHIW